MRELRACHCTNWSYRLRAFNDHCIARRAGGRLPPRRRREGYQEHHQLDPVFEASLTAETASLYGSRTQSCPCMPATISYTASRTLSRQSASHACGRSRASDSPCRPPRLHTARIPLHDHAYMGSPADHEVRRGRSRSPTQLHDVRTRLGHADAIQKANDPGRYGGRATGVCTQSRQGGRSSGEKVRRVMRPATPAGRRGCTRLSVGSAIIEGSRMPTGPAARNRSTWAAAARCAG